MTTPAERAAEKRQEKLDDIAKQVEDGTLKIRKMTPAERKQNPAPSQPRRVRHR